MKSKPIITAVIIAAIAIFVVAAVSSVITGPSDHYQRPEANLEQLIAEQDGVADSTINETTEPAVSEDVQAAQAQEHHALESAVESVADTASEVIDAATEEALNTSSSAIDLANKTIEEAQKVAEAGKQEAEALLEKVTEEAKEAVETVTAAAPKTHTVAANGMVFNPLVVNIAPGDTVAWTNMSTHNIEAIEGFIPEGTELFMSEMSQNYIRTFNEEGIYIYKCTPHFGTGMGGVIIVGKPVNLEAIKAKEVSGAARRLVNRAIQAAEAM